jgi:hypothetical protein
MMSWGDGDGMLRGEAHWISNSERPGWHQPPTGGGQMRKCFRPYGWALPMGMQAIEEGELQELADIGARISTGWGRIIKIWLGPQLNDADFRRGFRSLGRYLEQSGWILIALGPTQDGERVGILWHELWHHWCADPSWLPGESEAIASHGDRVRAGWRARPDTRRTAEWCELPDEAEAEAFSWVAMGGGVRRLPGDIYPEGAALRAFQRIAGQK